MNATGHIAIGAVLAGLAACGPMSASRAYDICSERARLAAHPRGMVGVGVGSGGPTATGSITISSDYLRGRDPYLVYDACFRQHTGAGPTRPLSL